MIVLLVMALQSPTLEEILQAFAERAELAETPAARQQAAETALGQVAGLPASARTAFHRAELSVYAGRTAEAAEGFEAFRRDHPADPNAATALLNAAGLREELGTPDRARVLYRRFDAEFPADERAEGARLQAAHCLLYARREAEALAELAAVDSWPARRRLALAQHLTGANAACRATLERIAGECPDREFAASARRLLEQHRLVDRPLPALKAGAFEGPLLLTRFSALDPGALVEAQTFQRIRRRHPGLPIAGLAVDATPEALEHFKRRAAPDWRLIHDPFGKGSTPLAGAAEPFVLLADAGGTVRFVQLTGQDLIYAVDRLLPTR